VCLDSHGIHLKEVAKSSPSSPKLHNPAHQAQRHASYSLSWPNQPCPPSFSSLIASHKCKDTQNNHWQAITHKQQHSKAEFQGVVLVAVLVAVLSEGANKAQINFKLFKMLKL
jgi:hypothetical protein